jgi:2'-5' RNA ligase
MADFAHIGVDLSGDIRDRVLAFAAAIPDEEIDPEDGRTDRVHVTLKYGLNDEEPDAAIELLQGEPPVTIRLGKTSVFPADEKRNSDVVKIEVHSPDLKRLNRRIDDNLEHTDTYSDYVPHLTVAYVKPGLGRKYAGDDRFEGEEFTINNLVFSDTKKNRTIIKLRGGKLNELVRAILSGRPVREVL